MMRIELDRLGKDGMSFAHAYQPHELDLGEDEVRLTLPPVINGHIKREGRETKVKGSITAQAEVDCDRCLQPIVVPVQAEFDVSYLPAKDYTADTVPELSEEDLSVSIFEGETIDIDDLTREQVLLALPSRAICNDDCKGLCPICGNNKNMQACQCESTEIDPRWTALKNLVNGK